ncbi:hypothetical protein MGSAQ_001723 [marine sediment metagenome]|uniref:Uncharacterized protein n=1 Tax=marine sediment metagenome TaxID=412755 RepID=A0A1B6NTG6_9ZZZZ
MRVDLRARLVQSFCGAVTVGFVVGPDVGRARHVELPD